MKIPKIITIGLIGVFAFALLGVMEASSYQGDIGIDETVQTSEPRTADEPEASPSAGTYTSAQSVTLSAPYADYIRYTTDGTNPTCETGTLYSSAISVGSSMTIKAIACYEEPLSDIVSFSTVESFAYTISVTPPPSGGGGGAPSPDPDPDEPEDFNTQVGCEGADFYWYDGACHAEPDEEVDVPVVDPDDDEPLLDKPISQMTREEMLAAIIKLQAMIASLRAQIGEPTPTDVPTACQGITFNRNLSLGSTGTDVRCLQAILNMSADTRVALTGPGSPGNETQLFGPLTRAAVVTFQNKYAAEVLTPIGLTAGTGFVGAQTRAKLNQILGR